MPKQRKPKDADSRSQGTEYLRVQQPNALRSLLAAPNSSFRLQLRKLELVEKLPLKLYEELAVCLTSNKDDAVSRAAGGCPNLEVLSLSGSCCGDAAVLVSAVLIAHGEQDRLMLLPLLLL
jgi:hypothetical protein